MTTRKRTNTPAIPFIFLYDKVGRISFGTVGVWHTWDSQAFKTSHFIYDLDSNRIKLGRVAAGYYEITFECSFDTDTLSGGSAKYIESAIYHNGVVLEGSKTRSWLCFTNTLCDMSCQSIHYIIYLEKGDTIQVKSKTNISTGKSIAETSRIFIKFLPQHGFNNSHGGRIEYKGEVLR